MQNLKTGIVVALLLAVCYGAFKALNAPEPDLPPELAEWAAEGTDLDSLVGDIQVPDQKLRLGSELEIPNLAVPQISLPESGLNQSSNPVKPENSSNAQVLVGAQPLTQSVDGPSIKIPSQADVLSEPHESLVLDNLPQPQVERSAQSQTGLTQAIPNAGDQVAIPNAQALNEFPSIPLPTNSFVSTQKLDSPPLLAETGNESLAQSAKQPDESKDVVLEPFAIAREKSLKLANEGKLKEALISLTPYYRSPEITHNDYEDLLEILDALAREVIFSPRHLLRPAYTTVAGDTLVSIAGQHKISPELLKSINQLGESQALTQGQVLKVLEGPFRGEVGIARGEMTVYLQDMYACRFPIAVGADYDKKIGKFEVADKRTDRTYYGAGGKVVQAGDPSNPYGGHWIDLGGNCIHGSPEMLSADLKDVGCIGLAPIDAADAFIMLSVGSQVEFLK